MRFATTRWSMVLAAAGGAPGEQADRALAELCAGYWYPLYAYVRRRGYDAEDARDLTQAFFARLLERRGLASADPSRGRFRSFLLTAMKNFLASEWRRQAAAKRGGGADVVSIDAADAEQRYRSEPADTRTPEALYERRWALALLERAVADVRQGYADRGQAELFDALKAYLGFDVAEVSYEDLSVRLGRSEPALRTAVSRLRARWRTRVRALVSETVQDGRLVDDELRNLLRMLSPP
ncbi:MAG: sigma-70 family RNA polymerase sigma factor [Acidobacteria bacterium]|nr:sigma-70 family RNA polymerase sigma factor [Acidobacteriota bacterium]